MAQVQTANGIDAPVHAFEKRNLRVPLSVQRDGTLLMPFQGSTIEKVSQRRSTRHTCRQISLDSVLGKNQLEVAQVLLEGIARRQGFAQLVHVLIVVEGGRPSLRALHRPNVCCRLSILAQGLERQQIILAVNRGNDDPGESGFGSGGRSLQCVRCGRCRRRRDAPLTQRTWP